jgi:hypothetical protein
MRYLQLSEYKTRVYWAIGHDDWNKLTEYFTDDDRTKYSFLIPGTKSESGCVYSHMKDPDEWNSVLIWFPDKKPFKWTICHEVMHAVQSIFDYIGYRSPRIEEVHCYLAEYIFCQTEHAIKNVNAEVKKSKAKKRKKK